MSNILERTPVFKDVIFGNTNSNYEANTLPDSLKNDAILRSVVLIEDAINFRSIFHKVSRWPLVIYRLYYSKSTQRFLYVIIFAILMLAFIESPSSISYSSDITKPKSYTTKYEFECGVIETFDFFFLLIFLFDCIVKSYLVGRKQVLKSPWLIAYYVVLTVSFIDCILSLSFKCEETIRIRRYLRPFFLIQCSSLMKKTIKSLRRTLPQIISVFVLLISHLYLFAIIGMLIFPRYYEEQTNYNTTNLTYAGSVKDGNDTFPVIDNKVQVKNKAFSSIKVALINLLILITSSNNPDVTIQSYSENRFAALYYITFLIIGLYSLMSLFIAVIYNQFKGFFQDSMMSSAFRHSLGIRAAFWVLYEKFRMENKQGCIPKAQLIIVIKNLKLDKKRKKYLLKVLDETNSGISELVETDVPIDLEQFEKLFTDNLNDEIDTTDYDELFNSNSYERRINNFSSKIAEIRRFFKRVYLSNIYLTTASVITITNIGCITIELHLLEDLDTKGTNRPLSMVIFGFSIFYLLENVLKIWALHWKRYVTNYLNLLEGVIVIAFFLTQVAHLIVYHTTYMSDIETKEFNESTSLWGLSRMINMLLIFRLIHLAPSIKVMYAIISTAIDIFRSLKPLFGIMAATYYIYALFGMQLFANKIRLDTFDKYNKSKLTFNALDMGTKRKLSMRGTFLYHRIKYWSQNKGFTALCAFFKNPRNLNEYCGTYKQLSFWVLNFNDFYSALNVLWNIMVINNWYVIVDAFVDATNEWSRFYFYLWWAICPVITLNMVVSLILDLFVLKWEKTAEVKIASFSARTPLIKSIHRLFSEIKWKPDDRKINDELIKHSYIDFSRLIQNFSNEENFSSQ